MSSTYDFPDRELESTTVAQPTHERSSADTDDIDWDRLAEERLGQCPVEDEPTPAVKRAVAHFWEKATQYDHEKLQAIYNDMHELQDRVETIPLSQALDAMDLALQIIDRLLDEPQTVSAWRLTETAPKDGTRFLATGGGLGKEVEVVTYNERVGCWNAETCTLDDTDHEPQGYNRPTHWQPMPDTSSVTRPLSKCDGADDFEHLDGMLDDRERG